MTPFERVKLSRERTAATFPLPTPVDCIRYAITELAEYDDALLRQERAGDKRNNDKAHSAERELGQALYMLLSAAIQFGFEPCHYSLENPPQWVLKVTYYGAMAELAQAAESIYCNVAPDVPAIERETEEYVIAKIGDAYSGMVDVAALHGWNVDALIDATCNDFERKHAEVTA